MLLRIRNVGMDVTTVCVYVVRNEWTELDCSCEAAPEELQEHSMVAHQVGFYLSSVWLYQDNINVIVSQTA